MAIILAVGVSTGLNLVILAVLIDAFYATRGIWLSENATQIIVGGMGGMIGVLGAYLGFRAGERVEARRNGVDPPAGS